MEEEKTKSKEEGNISRREFEKMRWQKEVIEEKKTEGMSQEKRNTSMIFVNYLVLSFS